MRGNLSEESIEYIKEIEDAINCGNLDPNEIVTIDDQVMTAAQAIRLWKENSLTSRTYGAHKKQSLS